MSKPESRRAGRSSEVDRERVQHVLSVVWRGNQREMARAIGVSQGLISKVVNGLQSPGRRLLAALAAYPGVNEEWVWNGKGEPVATPDRGALPVAVGVLPGPPLDFRPMLTGARHPVAATLDRPTRYWVALVANSPLVREPDLRLTAGDLLLLESDRAWTRRTDLVDGRICGVRLAAHPDPEYHLGRVLVRADILTVCLFGGSYLPPGPLSSPAGQSPERRTQPARRKVRPLAREERKRLERERREEEARAAARGGLPIRPEDIVAVQIYMVRPAIVLA